MRLIDADELKKGCSRLPCVIDDEGLVFMRMKAVINRIDTAPTVDAVEVVRCRDCTHGSQYDDGSDNYVCGYGGTKKGSGFCSEGERRKRDEDGVD